jgi:hypothetical protein
MSFAELEKRKAIRGKNFNTLTPEEKKTRIKQLWGRIRLFVFVNRIVRSIQTTVDAEYIRKMKKQASILIEDDECDDQKIPLAWYLLTKSQKFVIFWELIFSLLCCWNMLTVPLMIAFSQNYQDIPQKFTAIEIFLELLWVISIIQRCLTAEPPRTVTIGEIVRDYARSGYLFIDVIATGAILILLLMNRKDISPFFGLLRFFHWQALFFPFQFYFDHYSKATKIKKQNLMRVVEVFVFILILDHFLACMWIILGGRDIEG